MKKWRVDISTVNGTPVHCICCNQTGPIATMLRHNPHTVSESEIEKNANLIASAPELLDVLKIFVEITGGFSEAQLGKKYPAVALAWADAKELIESLTN